MTLEKKARKLKIYSVENDRGQRVSRVKRAEAWTVRKDQDTWERAMGRV